MHCLYCGSDDHPWFNCRKKPEGWKPPTKSTAAHKQADGGLEGVAMAIKTSRKLSAVGVVGSPQVKSLISQSESGNSVDTKRGRPRSIKPSEGKTKRAAEMRDYMRQYRARKKADER